MLYLDYNATHPPFTDILHEAVDAYHTNWANPSGISHSSQRNQARIEQARSSILAGLHVMHGWTAASDVHKTPAPPGRLLFLSTGTEAVYHMIAAFADQPCRRIIVSPYEHECMYAACRHFGFDIDMLDADSTGRVDPDQVRAKLQSDPAALVSITAACNETGVIQPLREIRDALQAAGHNIPLLSDSIQVAGKTLLDLSPADAIITNGHKVGAGPGAAALSMRDSLPFRPIFRGGLQEQERRAGTENLPAICSLDAAIRRQGDFLGSAAPAQRPGHAPEAAHAVIETMLKEHCGAVIVAEGSPRTATTYAVFPAMQNMDFLLMGLDREGILCSTGSSCKSRARRPSDTLQRMGFSAEESLRALRFSTGFFTRADDVERFCATFPALYHRCR